MNKYENDVLLKAFDAFLEEDKKLAEDAGYDLVTASDTNGSKLYLDLEANYEDIPILTVNVKKGFDDCYVFEVEAEFPDVKLNGNKVTMKDYIEAWEPVAALVDDLLDIKFDPEAWID